MKTLLRSSLKRPIASRCIALFGALAAATKGGPAHGQDALDADEAARRGRETSVVVQAAEARIGASNALHAGANLLVRENPTLSVWGGPRLLPTGVVLADLTLALSWPFDLSGSRARRTSWVDAAVRVAEAEAEDARRAAALDAREAWLDAALAREQVALSRARLPIDESALRIAEARRTHGAAGDDEVALARLGVAGARARLLAHEGAERASLERLRGRLRAPGPVVATGSLEAGEPAALEALLAALSRRPDVLRAERAAEAARRDVLLQERLGVPLARVGLGLGRENEYYARVGVDVGLPVFQRNQTAVAQARAQIAVAEAERARVLAQAETELRSAYAQLEGARRALDALSAALPHAEEAERLTLRAYELGQRPLAELLVTLREAAALRQSHYEAAASVARAQLAVERAAGQTR